MSILESIQSRYTAKVYDKTKQVPSALAEQLIEATRLAPSSVNSQPWHFVVVESEEAKQRLATAIGEDFAFNKPKILDSSFTIIFCARQSLPDDYLEHITDLEEAAGRLPTAEAKAGVDKVRKFFTGLHRDAGDVPEWSARQLYLALGGAMYTAAALKLDSTPIEGLDTHSVDAEFGLTDKGLASLVLLTVGYHSDEDFNYGVAKSRLPAEEVITRL
ncbi:Oxygen-insensitive NAD(P)H nitroreductase [Carnimonas sp. R-84981]|uniref:oxygen-insensitive NAD(P)H nitroreductase n=1 Tax=Carnimonas bestiolae TaxID=3402172 RepID=UPI003EDC143C